MKGTGLLMLVVSLVTLACGGLAGHWVEKGNLILAGIMVATVLINLVTLIMMGNE